ncbi:peptidyl-prolyl cis-trans isomerase [Holotrichia oblita]|uniref:Peptidyl-prolyl cis-trans isomerase n=2 Tax=Holotrichia oblita TaxID=644536 RepID=A0ACB9T956_HOLOL|nr:peptidyl-prolyl cis-trans isomerase [Holotrichia oblita]
MSIDIEVSDENVYVFLDIKIGQEKCNVKTFVQWCHISVVPQFMVQCGDIINYDGSGGESVYGDIFDDENFDISHSTEGMIGMANAGPNSNSSQFYITTVPCTHLDGRNVAFGRVRKGLNIVREIQEVPRKDEIPLIKCMIENCGVLRPGEPWNFVENDGTNDVYPPYPDDWDLNHCENIDREFVDAITNIKESGNLYYYKDNYILSEKKYRKSLRYLDYWLSRQSFREPSVLDMKVVTLLNLAAVKLKRQNYYDVIKLCTEVISLDPKNHKALYRRGQAKMAIKDYREALHDFRYALKLQPHNTALQSEVKFARLCITNYTKKERELFAKMF